MQRRARPAKPSWMAWLCSFLLICLIVGTYIVTAHLLVGSETPSSASQSDQRDTIYFAIHGAGLLVALVTGFALGKWLNGLGAAFSLLFFAIVATVMSVGQVAAYQAACSGQNDIIRHWTC